jgi:hypothetical protein
MSGRTPLAVRGHDHRLAQRAKALHQHAKALGADAVIIADQDQGTLFPSHRPPNLLHPMVKDREIQRKDACQWS